MHHLCTASSRLAMFDIFVAIPVFDKEKVNCFRNILFAVYTYSLQQYGLKFELL